MNRLLYIHNISIVSSQRGSLNTTLLQVFSMCNAFVKAGYEVTLAMEGGNNFTQNLNFFINNSFQEILLFEIVTWNRKCRNQFINKFLIRSQLKSIIEKYKYELIFTREPLFLKTILKFKIPVIFESHNSLQHTKLKILHHLIKNIIIKSSKKPNFKCLFSISKSLSNYWENNGVSPFKLFAWHDGFDSNLFYNKIDKKESRAELGIPADKILAVYTGGLYPDREIENIINLGKEFPEVLFLIIGGPEKNKEVFQFITKKQEINNVHFTGFIIHNNIPKYLFAADILLALWSKKVPTINFCSPLKLFEYMAAGRTIVAHNFPTIREVLVPEKDAIFCEPDNFESLKVAFKKAIELSQINDIGERIRKKAFDLYTWNNRVRMLLQFLK